MKIPIAPAASLCVLGTITLSGLAVRLPIVGNSSLLDILQASLSFLRLIIFVPVIKMLQRTLVIHRRSQEVFSFAIVSLIGLSIALFLSSIIVLVLAMSSATCTGASVAILKLYDPAFGSSAPEGQKAV
jgi:hypothetical protein